MERKALEYDPRNPGGKILIGAFGNKLVRIDDNRHVLTVADRVPESPSRSSIISCSIGERHGDGPEGRMPISPLPGAPALGQKVHVLDPFDNTSPGIAHLRKSIIRLRS